MTTIVLGVSGSIAAYKACELTRLLVQDNYAVHVIMTKAATQFVTPLTLRTLSRNPVCDDMFATPENWLPEHISLAEKADLVLVAPCTANVIAKIAAGIADDIVCATVLATKAPVMLTPAMNVNMWANPVTQANVALLETRGIKFIDAESGALACGTSGKGRMAEPEIILQAVTALFSSCKK